MIRLMIVDDHAVVRQGLERLAATWEGIEFAAAASDGARSVELYGELRPDVVLMDLGMAGELDGVEATRGIVAIDPGARVVVLTSHPDQDHVEQALEAGAIGYVLKFAEAEEIERAVRSAARGESPIDPKVAHILMRARPSGGVMSTLSTREREVLALLGRGLPNKLIALRLAITERTVKGHLTSIYRQIGVTDRVGAALFARANGLAGQDPPGNAGSTGGGSGSRPKVPLPAVPLRGQAPAHVRSPGPAGADVLHPGGPG